MPEQMVEDPSYRRVVNTLEGTTNIVDMQDQRQKLLRALDMCEKSLSKHCGPTSGYAMLVDALSIGLEFNPNIFTKDGIGILSAIEFLSPLETYIKHLITYVGGRVDSVAKDGTTSSMLFLTGMLKNMLKNSEEWQKLKLTTREINRIVEDFTRQFLSELEKYKHTYKSLNNNEEPSEDEAMEYAGQIAFMQAMSSSGGNVPLARAMGRIFTGSPRITWDQISYYNSIKETSEAFSVEIDDFDTHFRCILNGDNVMNHALGTEYLVEDVDVICYPDAMADYSVKNDNIIQYLRECPDERPIVVVSTFASSSLITSVRDINLARKNKISLWQYSPEEKLAGQNYPWELFIFCAIAGIRPYSMPNVPADEPFGPDYIFRAKKVHYHDTYLDFYGIVDMPEHSCIHPFYAHPEKATPFYKEVREAIEKQLENYREGNKKDGVMANIFIMMLNRLVSVHRPTLRLGGTTHEQLSNISVVQDVQGATMSSLNHGFIAGGPIILWFVMEKLQNWIPESYTAEHRAVLELFKDAIGAAVNTMCRYVYSPLELEKLQKLRPSHTWYYNALTPTGLRDNHHIEEYLHELKIYHEASVNDAIDGLLPPFLELIHRDYPILHPFRVYTELMKRVQEVAVKLALTNEIIVGGGVVMKKEETKDGDNQSEQPSDR